MSLLNLYLHRLGALYTLVLIIRYFILFWNCRYCLHGSTEVALLLHHFAVATGVEPAGLPMPVLGSSFNDLYALYSTFHDSYT